MENLAAWAWTLDVDLPSERGASHKVLEPLFDQLGVHGWAPGDIFGVHLAAEEAIVNAILHGNRLDPTKQVHVSVKVSTEVIRIEIIDEGSGFDPSVVPDCTEDDRLEVPSGRGLMLIRSFMTRVEHNETGNRVLLEKQRGVQNLDHDATE